MSWKIRVVVKQIQPNPIQILINVTVLPPPTDLAEAINAILYVHDCATICLILAIVYFPGGRCDVGSI